MKIDVVFAKSAPVKVDTNQRLSGNKKTMEYKS